MTQNESYTGADLFIDALEEYGVTHVFGNPGTTELPVMRALEKSDIEYVLGLHEDIAVGMGAGYASTRRYHAHHDPDINPVGVVNLHIAPGVAHGLGNLYGASVAGVPLVVTAGDHSSDFRHEEPILGGDLVEMTRQFTKWSEEVKHVDALPTMVRRAFRVALTPPTGPVFLSLPVDVMNAETDEEPERLGAIPNAGRGDPNEVENAAQLLVEAENPVIVLGDHVARSGADSIEAAVRLAEATGARVHGEILACEVNFPGDHDQWISYIPPDEGIASYLMNTDTIAFVGCSTNTTLVSHDDRLVPKEATCIHIGDDAWELGKNQPADAAVVGDPGLVMDQVADIVEDRLSDEKLEERLDFTRQMKEMTEQQMTSLGESDVEDDPRASKAELVDTMRDTAGDAYIVDESITSKYALLTRWPLDPEQAISNKGGGLGYGLPAAVGAGLAERQTDSPRDVIGFIGDGSYLYYPHTLYTAARYDVDLTVVIPDNRNYRILKDNTLEMFGGSEGDYDFIGMDIDPPVDIPKNAESHGARGRLVEKPGDIAESIEGALDETGPTVLDVLVHD